MPFSHHGGTLTNSDKVSFDNMVGRVTKMISFSFLKFFCVDRKTVKYNFVDFVLKGANRQLFWNAPNSAKGFSAKNKVIFGPKALFLDPFILHPQRKKCQK